MQPPDEEPKETRLWSDSGRLGREAVSKVTIWIAVSLVLLRASLKSKQIVGMDIHRLQRDGGCWGKSQLPNPYYFIDHRTTEVNTRGHPVPAHIAWM